MEEEDRKQKAQDEEYAGQRERGAEETLQVAPRLAEQARQYAENDAALKALRARLLASPPLPPDRNPLLGRWRVASAAKARGGGDMSQLMGTLSDPGGAVCEVVFGEGVTEFKPGSWASIDSYGDDSLGPIQYRIQDNQVFALPDQGVPLVGFDIVDKNTIREFRLADCALTRIGAASAPVADAPAPPGKVPAVAAAATALPHTQRVDKLLTAGDSMGYQCPNGQQPVVIECDDNTDTSSCGVVYVDQPMQNGFQMRELAVRGWLMDQLGACTTRKIGYDSKGNVKFAP